jgi:CHAT domain-containing protein
MPNEELKNKSDHLFVKGVEKYHSKQYEEAIPLFRECVHVDSIIYDANSSRLGYASMWLASCHFALGDVETAKSISDYYMTEPIDRRLTIKSDSISDIIYPILYDSGDGESAIPLIQKVLLMEKEELGEQNVWVGNSYGIYGYALLLSGHTEEAIDAYKQSLSIIETLCGDNSKPYAYVLSDMINAYSAKGDYHSAYIDACKVLDIYKTENLTDSNIYYTAVATCGDYLLNQGKYQESIPFLSESLGILSKMDLENSSDYAITLAGLGRAQLLTGEREKAKEALERSYSLLKQIIDPYDKRYLIQCMDYLSQANFIVGDTLTSIDLSKEAIALFENGNADKNFLYPELYFNLWNIYESLRKPIEAHQYAEKAIKNYRLLDCKDMNYASLLFRYSECVAKENHNKIAIQLASEALSFVENVPNIPDSVLIMYRSQLASQYSNNGDMDSAYYYAQAALHDIYSKFSHQSLNYILSLSKIAPVLWFSGKREDAMELYQEAVERVSTSYSGSESHFRILNDFANVCQLSGLYTKAVDIQKEAVRIAETLYGKGSEAYSESTAKLLLYSSTTNDVIELQSMIDRGNMNVSEQAGMTLQIIRQQVIRAVRQGNIPKAESLVTEACQIIAKESNGMSADYAFLLMFQAELYNSIGKSLEALSSLEKAYTIATSLWGKDKFEKYYFNYWNLRGIANANLKRWDEAENALQNSISVTKTLFGENHMEYLLPQAALAAIKNQNGDAEGAAQMMSTLFKSLREQIFLQFATMSSKERSAFWSQVSSAFNPGMPFFAYNSHNSKYYGDGYNALLLSKGLLLNTEQEINQLLINKNDKKGLELYNNLLMMKQRLNSLQVTATSKSLSEADSLYEAIRYGERELIANSSAYGDYTRNLIFSWQDVRDSLKTNDVAIEFTDFYDQDGNNLYVAFVLTRDMETPLIVQLFDYSDFSTLNSSEYYTTEALYNLVWKPLESFFSKDSRLFFSPHGVLNSIALESLPSNNGIPMSNNHSVYRLSSTRELCLNKSFNQKKSAVLYGDINYDVENEQKPNHAKDNQSSPHEKSKDIVQIRAAITDELPPLPGTIIEVDSIAYSFAQADRPVRIFTKEMATESSVRSLSSSDETILHIATHGYYMSSSESEGSFLTILSRNSFADNQEDLSLLRSGLYLAGANTTLSGDKIMNSDNDGILTAKEIANVDLHTFDLVSLSACQTGLGDVSGDGVFGIQRGFKKAGVKSLIMSLWNVDDSATCALMTEFYRCWLGGLSKYEALESAKSMVKSVEGWEDPKYWAAFILLDGMN